MSFTTLFHRLSRVPVRLGAALVPALLGVAGCGGGGEAAAQANAAPGLDRRQALAARPLDATVLMDYAERAYPDLFPDHVPTQTLPPYVYRYYARTGNYLGVANGEVLLMGTATAGAMRTVGRLSDFQCAVHPLDCPPAGMAVRPRPVSVAPGYTLAIHEDGRVLVFGTGMLAGTTVPLPGTTARVLVGVQDAVAVFAGIDRSFAITRDGSLWAWGRHNGLMGSSATLSFQYAHTPVLLADFGRVVDLVPTECANVLALRSDGTVWQSTLDAARSAVQVQRVPGIAGVVALASGGGDAGIQTICQQLAITAEGAAVRLREDGFAVHAAEQGPLYAVREGVPGLPPVRQISCTNGRFQIAFCAAVTLDGRVWTWGTDMALQSGRPDVDTRAGTVVPPGEVPGLSDADQVEVVPMSSTMVIRRSREAWGWGAFLDTSWTPVDYASRIRSPVAFAQAPPGVAFASSTQGTHALVLHDGSLWTAGANDKGQLGRTTTGNLTLGYQPVAGVRVRLSP